MSTVSVRALRENLRAVLERVEAGEEIVVVRRGREVALIVPPQRERPGFPDLTVFRGQVELRGEPPGDTLARMRSESR